MDLGSYGLKVFQSLTLFFADLKEKGTHKFHTFEVFNLPH